MKVVLIRHSKPTINLSAEDNENQGLSKLGEVRARVFAKKVAQTYPKIGAILTSTEIVCTQTAQIIADEYENMTYTPTPLLDIGTTYSDFQKLLDDNQKPHPLFIIGHYSELADIVRHLTGQYDLQLYFKKPSLVELSILDGGQASITYAYAHDDDNGFNTPFKKGARLAVTDEEEVYELELQ